MNAILLLLATIPPYPDGMTPVTYREEIYLAAAAVHEVYIESRGRIDKELLENPASNIDREKLYKLYETCSLLEWQMRPVLETYMDADGNVKRRKVYKNGKQVFTPQYTGGPLRANKTWVWTHNTDPRDCLEAALILKNLADDINQ
jgi:hypothetical protein